MEVNQNKDSDLNVHNSDSNNKNISKPKILPLPNGPLYLLNNSTPKMIENLQNSKGESLSTVIGIALCRCGASNNKPFCDGSHSIINFSTKKNNAIRSNDNGIEQTNMIKHKGKKNYVGRKITIHDNRKLCSHAEHCIKNLSSVFKKNQRPWINPDNATVEDIIETVNKCPSGALSYSIDGIEYKEISGRDPLITVSKNGPYVVTGGIELLGENPIAEEDSKEHYVLCRCGASNNKPFCDGSHNIINFQDERN